jgi:CheY-like chemotaxis protein
MAGALEPDVVLLDLKLPAGDGFAVAETLAALDPHPAVVLTRATVEQALLRAIPVS